MGSKKKNAQKGHEKLPGQPNGQQKITSSPKASKAAEASAKASKGKASKMSTNKADKKQSAQPPSSCSAVSVVLLLVLSVIVGGVAVIYANNDARSAAGGIFVQYLHPQVLKVSEFLSVDTSRYVQWVEDTLISAGDLQTSQSYSTTEAPLSEEPDVHVADELQEPAMGEEPPATVDDLQEAVIAEESAVLVSQKATIGAAAVHTVGESQKESNLAAGQEKLQGLQHPSESKENFKEAGQQFSADDSASGKELDKTNILPLGDLGGKERVEKPKVEEVKVTTIPKAKVDSSHAASDSLGREETLTPQAKQNEDSKDEMIDGRKAVAAEQPADAQPELAAKVDELSKPADKPNVESEPQQQEPSEPLQEQKRAGQPQVQDGSEPPQVHKRSETSQKRQEESRKDDNPEPQQKKDETSEEVNVAVPVSPDKDLGKEEKSPSKKKKDIAEARKEYAKSSITSDADFKIRKKLDKADDLLQKNQLAEALMLYDEILRKHDRSPRALLGKADTLDKMAEQQRSNDLLEQSITVYDHLLLSRNEVDMPPELLKQAGRRLANRQQFRGWGGKSQQTMKLLVDIFPGDVVLQRELGVSYLMIGKNTEAKQVFEKVLQTHPSDGFAKVHLGFIIKSYENNPAVGVKYLREGIETNEAGTQDGRFYFHLGDGLQRLGHNDEARKLFVKGAQIGVFLSPDQRSLYNVNSLTARPWWTPEQTGYQRDLKLLQDNWEMIRDEGLSQLDAQTGAFVPEDENLREKGEWKQLTMFQQGRTNKKVCERVPKTCALIDQIEDAKSCRRGQVKFSVMSPGVHVWPHCGPTNCRIRAHLGLVVPEGPKIRVVNETRTWKEGEFIIFDDSFEHEVWHNGTSLRLVLIVDFWHPELTEAQRRQLSPI